MRQAWILLVLLRYFSVSQQMTSESRLMQLVKRASEKATITGAVKKLGAADASFFRGTEDAMAFLLTKVDLAKKPTSKKGKRNAFDPFAKENLESALFIEKLSTTHSLVLNKFNLVSHHAIVITQEFERQESPLTMEDFDSFWTGVVELKVNHILYTELVAFTQRLH
jgi:ATP adenylyltransferase/5',5'''-P-1,P-4-tetraphosphate phosphorylase II